jgi:hypothetical protein
MLKKFAALIFVFVLAGQVWASVCLCLEGIGGEDSNAKMSCCEREKFEANSVSAKACCDAPCGENGSQKMPRSQADSSTKISAPVLSAVEKLVNSFNLQIGRKAFQPIPKRKGDVALQSANPPEIYLQNHAFLI